MTSTPGGSVTSSPAGQGQGVMAGTGAAGAGVSHMIGAPGVSRTSMSRFRIAENLKATPPGLCKKLVYNVTPDQDPFLKEAIQSQTLRMQIDHDAEVGLKAMQKEAHEQRMKTLRSLLKTMSEDDWMYPNPDQLLGLL